MIGADAALAACLDHWVNVARADRELRHIARDANFTVQGECSDGVTVWVRVATGRVSADIAAPEPDTGDTIVLRGGLAAWLELADPNAAPRRHDLLALTKAVHGIEIIEGRMGLIRHLRVLNRLVEIGRANE